jgi:hypothetical protein
MRARASVGIALLAVLHLVSSNASSALAQAGSTGGTIGKQDKSISGDEQQSEPSGARRPGRSTTQRPDERQALPQRIRFIQGSYSATLRHLGGNAYQGTWEGGELVSRMTVTMTAASITIRRKDISGSGLLWSVTYTGTRTGNTASGTFITAGPISGAQGSWEASW